MVLLANKLGIMEMRRAVVGGYTREQKVIVSKFTTHVVSL